MEVSGTGNSFDRHQEYVRTLEIVEFEYISFVFTQNWPSWAFALRGLDCKKLFKVVKWDTRLAKAYFEATREVISLLNSTKGNLKLVKSTGLLVFIQGSTDFIRKILDVIGEKDCRLICAWVVEDMGKSAKPSEARVFGGLYWKEISRRQFSGVTKEKWMFGCSTNLRLTGVMQLNKNVKKSLIRIISDLESG